MGNNDLSSSENILIKVDQNNLIYVDPNSVLNNGEVEPRGIKHENLVMYVNLEADMIPRTTLISTDEGRRLISIAKGTLNFLQNKNGEDYDTTWTESFFNKQERPPDDKEKSYFQNDPSAQTFGIDSINIVTKGYFGIPQVTMNFIDVRGKTLFESPENSPYSSFFHLPWPIFYLTVKGYYGKAIRYRLHLIKFNSKLNSNNGNFEITANFVGSTFAYMNDIPLQGILNAPYMFMVETSKDLTLNTVTEKYEQKISKTSRGYQMLVSIYNEYKQRGLIDQNFPVKTLRELLVVAESIDGILEREIFDQVVDQEIFAAIVEFEKNLKLFYDEAVAWGKQNLIADGFTGGTKDIFYYYIKGEDKTISMLDKLITGDDIGTLKNIIEKNKKQLSNDNSLTKIVLKKRNNTKVDFSFLNVNKKIKELSVYHTQDGTNKIGVAIDLLVNDITDFIEEFVKQKTELQREIELKMNEILKRDNFLGFEPTVRNIFAVILANADVYIRLLKDVHNRAFEKGSIRKNLLENFSDETTNVGAVYPWPEVKKNVGGSKTKVLAYPGDRSLISVLNTNDKTLWPEVDFVENYIAIATKKFDTLSEKEGGVGDINYVFSGDVDQSKIKKISALTSLLYGLPYVQKTIVNTLYEIYERSYYVALFDSFDDNTIKELSDIEFENLKESIKNDFDIISILNKKEYISSITDLIDKMRGLSPFERYPYLRDQLPTVTYVNSLLSTPFSIEQYVDTERNNSLFNNNDNDYPNLTNNLKNYNPEQHRSNLYPYNSNTYLSYLKKSSFTTDEFKLSNVLNVNTRNGFISSQVNPNMWVKSDDPSYVSNLFTQGMGISTSNVNILNTPFFHKQLFTDFNKSNMNGKYVGSAYLLLNSLPFKDLEDRLLNNSNIRLFALFKEIGSTHFIPYHLMVKWGSIYHRYKKYIVDGVDILDGCLDVNNKTENFNGNIFFDNLTNLTLNIDGETVTYSGKTDVGIHPYYDAIFHQIVNGYTHYNVSSGKTSFEESLAVGGIVEYKNKVTGINYWTSFVDNSKYSGNKNQYTILPSNGYYGYTSNDSFERQEQRAMRIIWGNENNNIDFSGQTFSSHSEYQRTYNSNSSLDNQFSFGNNYRKVIDLIATFSPYILEEFEKMFLNFSDEKINEELPLKRFPNVFYYQFQDLLKEIVTVEKPQQEIGIVEQRVQYISDTQPFKLENITKKILSVDNLISLSIGNPKEIDVYVMYGFADNSSSNTFSYRPYNPSQYAGNEKYIRLYLGEDIDGKYQQFFIINDVELNEENVLSFRSLIQMYAGYYNANPSLTPTNSDFKAYLRDVVFQTDSTNILTRRQTLFLNNIISKLSTLEEKSLERKLIEVSGYNNDETIKLEQYNYFKSFNDKWVAGNSIGQRLLLEEFLFLDRANRDIGSSVYLNLQRLIPLGDIKNQKANLYSVISMILQDSGFDMRPLPSYVNFYGGNYNNKVKQTPSKNIAKNLFGTFLEVDYQESSPKIIIQYVGPTSKHLDISREINKNYKFADDSFYVGNTNKNPLIITTPEYFNNFEMIKSNRVVAFEVSFGDQNQSIFKSIELDQSSFKNTTESMLAIENMGRSENGSSTYQVDIGLFDIYRQASYTCTVTAMGNVMIQPTMYFYLKNVPLFKGTYWITDVTHSIQNNNIVTKFTGVRIPYTSLPDPKDSLMSSYKPLFDAVINKVTALINQKDKTTTNTEQIVNLTDGTTRIVDVGDGLEAGATLLNESGFNIAGVPYNGYESKLIGGTEKYIQKIKYRPINIIGFGTYSQWLRTKVVKINGQNYTVDENWSLSLYKYNGQDVKWSDIDINKYPIFSTRFLLNKVEPSKILNTKTIFYNPKTKKSAVIGNESNLSATPKKIIKGAVSVGPIIPEYGIAMSQDLLNKLGLQDGDVVYFNMY